MNLGEYTFGNGQFIVKDYSSVAFLSVFTYNSKMKKYIGVNELIWRIINNDYEKWNGNAPNTNYFTFVIENISVTMMKLKVYNSKTGKSSKYTIFENGKKEPYIQVGQKKVYLKDFKNNGQAER